jgi:hypothetical protein
MRLLIAGDFGLASHAISPFHSHGLRVFRSVEEGIAVGAPMRAKLGKFADDSIGNSGTLEAIHFAAAAVRARTGFAELSEPHSLCSVSHFRPVAGSQIKLLTYT